MDKTIAAKKLSLPEGDIKSVDVAWSAPASRQAILYGPNCNVTKWYYTVELQNRHVLTIMEQPPEEEILEFIKARYPYLLR